MIDTEENEVRFTMRMDKNLYEQLKKSAKKNRRSIAKELEYLTDFHLNQGTPITMPDNIANKFIEFLRHSPEFLELERKAGELNKNSDI